MLADLHIAHFFRWVGAHPNYESWPNVGKYTEDRLDVCSWRWADVDKMTVGFLTLSQRWPNVGKYTEDSCL